MASTTKSAYTDEQTAVWIRGLVSLAWADGNFDTKEQAMISALLHKDFNAEEKTDAMEPISADELAKVLGSDRDLAENFLRTAVMVALADQDYSVSEDKMLQQYCQALGLKADALDILRNTFHIIANAQPAEGSELIKAPNLTSRKLYTDPVDLLHPVRDWLDRMDIQDPKIARLMCKMIPSQCPFERDITLFGRKIVHVPPLCKLNPLYDQLVSLRFRALSYLADDCKEDISEYV
ncbi:TerB family tellurite resistance protein [Phormidium sp. CLA17]|uniref:Mo-dependent nitrogenase C-terminal domain-containing protein n=1 Tax=Leptolyngbya sp. Cla-17 TaxID=2803751 RepID=UPI001492C353|nr:Mo-dependent nitrogenase C-terminal domain-containing protein [Leptolyngbya sp. Cla-17]MBM0743934.1 TerB family tellurite resistance protein [Leptolyngbya sp. Cla-17]